MIAATSGSASARVFRASGNTASMAWPRPASPLALAICCLNTGPRVAGALRQLQHPQSMHGSTDEWLQEFGGLRKWPARMFAGSDFPTGNDRKQRLLAVLVCSWRCSHLGSTPRSPAGQPMHC